MEAATSYPGTPVDEWTFVTKDAGGSEVTVNIENAYREYVSGPDQLESILSRFATTLAQINASAGVDQLVLIVRPSDYIARALGQQSMPDKGLAARPLAGDLALFLAVDSPTSIRTANVDDLKLWGLSERQAWDKAVLSIKARVGELAFAQLEGEPNSSLLVADSGLAPSILADASFCGPQALDGMDGTFVLLFGRDALLFGFPRENASIDTFWEIAKELIKSGEAMSATPITCSGGKWKSVAIPAD